MKYEAIKMIRFEFDWNSAINKLTINGIKLISRLTEFLSTSKVREQKYQYNLHDIFPYDSYVRNN